MGGYLRAGRFRTEGAVFVLSMALCLPTQAIAGGVQTLETVEIVDSKDSLVGAADTATEGTVLKEQLESRPIYRVGELLENMPGLIVTQHSGEGKANQYYLRGFNLDHGTDIAITVDDMPVNMRTHGHGQGYSDLNFLIPELLGGMQYRKGTYYAEEGDFATAGAVHMSYVDRLDKDLMEVGGGSFGYGRGFAAQSLPLGRGTLLTAAEIYHLDGPWTHPDDYRKVNGVVRYSEGTDANGWSATAMAYAGRWNASNQAPERAIADGQLSYWGTEDPSDGGFTERYSLSGKFGRTDGNSRLKVSAYLIASRLELYNNFTFFLYDPVHGDQFHQHDGRLIAGGKASYSLAGRIAGRDTETTVGTDLRNDDIHLGLYQTWNRQYLSTDRADDVTERSIGLYVENRTQWFDKLRTVAGLREDMIWGADHADNFRNGGTSAGYKLSPKGSLVLGPWAATELYLSAGMGIHSNDVRATTTTVEPTTTASLVQGPAGQPLNRFPLLERASGEEVGIRTAPLPHLQTSLALFRLMIASEQVFAGDAGDTEPSAKSVRQGVEFSNFYTPFPGVIIDADAAVTQARFHGSDDGKYIAGSPRLVLGAGLALNDLGDWSAGIQYRMFGPRPLTDDNSIRSPATSIVNVRVGYKLSGQLALRLDIDNLLDAKAQDISYAYASRLKTEPLSLVGTGVEDVHVHPAEPLGFRLSLIGRF
ncbi:MAG: TonB-dependent receptor plug domain-containing protein [Telmatospirillum sp.]|nr:TonB-dependent receptor plug domain-containing protein [Telmatospirillum sp.]